MGELVLYLLRANASNELKNAATENMKAVEELGNGGAEAYLIIAETKAEAKQVENEYAYRKEEKEELERISRAVTKMEITYQAYEGVEKVPRVYNAGRASYVERNQEMIKASKYCVFYCDPYYRPPKRKQSKKSLTEYQPKSGTRLALEYAYQQKRGGQEITILNIYEEEESF